MRGRRRTICASIFFYLSIGSAVDDLFMELGCGRPTPRGRDASNTPCRSLDGREPRVYATRSIDMELPSCDYLHFGHQCTTLGPGPSNQLPDGLRLNFRLRGGGSPGKGASRFIILSFPLY